MSYSCDPMNCSLPGSSVHRISQAKLLEWVAISFSRGSYWPRDRTWVSCIAGRRFTIWATREALKILPQNHSSKVSVHWHLAFFTVQLSHPYITTGKTIALTRQTFVSKVMSLLFNMLSRLVIPFLPRSKRLFISWLQSPSAVILEPPKIKSATVSIVSLFICHEVMQMTPP